MLNTQWRIQDFPSGGVDLVVVLLSQLLHNTLRIPSEFYHLRGLQKDTNCQSELKPVFIYTGIHMFVSCSIIFERVLEQRKPVLLCTTKLYNMIHWSSQQ